MTQFFVPSRQVYAPELLVPGEKPVGPVEIDYRKPLSNSPRLVSCILTGNGPPKDLVTGQVGKKAGSTGLATNVGTPEGTAVFVDKVGSDVEHWEVPWDYTFKNPDGYMTIVVVWKEGTNTSSWQTFLQLKTSGLGVIWYSARDAQGESCLTDYNEWANSSTDPGPFASGDYVICAVTAKRDGVSDDCYFYLNGIEDNTETFECSLGNIETIMLQYNTEFTEEAGEGYLYAAYVFDGFMAAEQHAQLAFNPYQILKPIGPEWLMVGTAVVGAEASMIPPRMHRNLTHLLVR